MNKIIFDQERQKVTHLLVLLVYTFFTIALVGESFLMGWDTGAVVLLLMALIASWVIHVTEIVPDTGRIWIYFILTLLTFFFYGIHETSIFDIAPVMIVIIILFSSLEQYIYIKLCILTYCLTMLYDFIFVINGTIDMSALELSRIMLHFFTIFMSGQVAKTQILKKNKEKENIIQKISELEEANHRTEDFLTNVSHELRTPINAVIGITTTMLKSETDPEKRSNLDAIQTAGQRLYGQIGDILDYTEIDTGRIKISEENYMISSLVNDIIINNRLAKRNNNLELIFDVDSQIPAMLKGDEKKIKKIIQHLIDNAFKFTHKGGIYVRVYHLKKSYGINLCIKVTDTGIGIAEEELEKIKEHFYQSNGGRNRRAGGLGLGLSIVYGLVAAMEGFIQIESTYGKGTTVSISIPQSVAESKSSITINNKEELCVACYINTEKYTNPQIRDFYNDMITHMDKELDVNLHRTSQFEELKKIVDVYKLTHIFTAKEEYENNRKYFDELAEKMNVIVAADGELSPDASGRIKVIRKPLYCLQIANILNAGPQESETALKEKYMVCPGIKVLVVDDEPMNLMVAEGIFKNYQMTVKTAQSGRRAIELCSEEDFDLIFLDHMMPDMDGIETFRRLRKLSDEMGKVYTIIAFTANAVSGAREMFLSEGFDEFISKPIETLEMDRVLRKVLPKNAISYIDSREFLHKDKTDKTDTAGKEAAVHSISYDSMPEGKLESVEIKDKLELLESTGINTHSGMQYCAGDRSFYEELLEKFALSEKSKLNEINNFYEKGDYKNYCILVHALKSTAKMIGADELSEQAKELESAAKREDGAYISSNNDNAMKQYEIVAQNIINIYELVEDSADAQAASGSEIKKEELLKMLSDLKDNIDAYEVENMEGIISKLKEYAYEGKPVGDMIGKISHDIEEFDFAAALEGTVALISSLEGGEA